MLARQGATAAADQETTGKRNLAGFSWNLVRIKDKDLKWLDIVKNESRMISSINKCQLKVFDLLKVIDVEIIRKVNQEITIYSKK